MVEGENFLLPEKKGRELFFPKNEESSFFSTYYQDFKNTVEC